MLINLLPQHKYREIRPCEAFLFATNHQQQGPYFRDFRGHLPRNGETKKRVKSQQNGENDKEKTYTRKHQTFQRTSYVIRSLAKQKNLEQEVENLQFSIIQIPKETEIPVYIIPFPLHLKKNHKKQKHYANCIGDKNMEKQQKRGVSPNPPKQITSISIFIATSFLSIQVTSHLRTKAMAIGRKNSFHKAPFLQLKQKFIKPCNEVDFYSSQIFNLTFSFSSLL